MCILHTATNVRQHATQHVWNNVHIKIALDRGIFKVEQDVRLSVYICVDKELHDT